MGTTSLITGAPVAGPYKYAPDNQGDAVSNFSGLTQAARNAATNKNSIDLLNMQNSYLQPGGVNSQLANYINAGDFASAFKLASSTGKLDAMIDPTNLYALLPNGMTQQQFQDYYTAFAPYEKQLAGTYDKLGGTGKQAEGLSWITGGYDPAAKAAQDYAAAVAANKASPGKPILPNSPQTLGADIGQSMFSNQNMKQMALMIGSAIAGGALGSLGSAGAAGEGAALGDAASTVGAVDSLGVPALDAAQLAADVAPSAGALGDIAAAGGAASGAVAGGALPEAVGTLPEVGVAASPLAGAGGLTAGQIAAGTGALGAAGLGAAGASPVNVDPNAGNVVVTGHPTPPTPQPVTDPGLAAAGALAAANAPPSADAGTDVTVNSSKPPSTMGNVGEIAGPALSAAQLAADVAPPTLGNSGSSKMPTGTNQLLSQLLKSLTSPAGLNGAGNLLAQLLSGNQPGNNQTKPYLPDIAGFSGPSAMNINSTPQRQLNPALASMTPQDWYTYGEKPANQKPTGGNFFSQTPASAASGMSPQAAGIGQTVPQQPTGFASGGSSSGATADTAAYYEPFANQVAPAPPGQSLLPKHQTQGIQIPNTVLAGEVPSPLQLSQIFENPIARRAMQERMMNMAHGGHVQHFDAGGQAFGGGQQMPDPNSQAGRAMASGNFQAGAFGPSLPSSPGGSNPFGLFGLPSTAGQQPFGGGQQMPDPNSQAGRAMASGNFQAGAFGPTLPTSPGGSNPFGLFGLPSTAGQRPFGGGQPMMGGMATGAPGMMGAPSALQSALQQGTHQIDPGSTVTPSGGPPPMDWTKSSPGASTGMQGLLQALSQQQLQQGANRQQGQPFIGNPNMPGGPAPQHGLPNFGGGRLPYPGGMPQARAPGMMPQHPWMGGIPQRPGTPMMPHQMTGWQGMQPRQMLTDPGSELHAPQMPAMMQQQMQTASPTFLGAAHGGAINGALGQAMGAHQGHVQGPGDGQSDDIDAKLSDGEYVIPADVVSALGNGSNSAGARSLDGLRTNVRKHVGARMADGKQTPKAKLAHQYLGK